MTLIQNFLLWQISRVFLAFFQKYHFWTKIHFHSKITFCRISNIRECMPFLSENSIFWACQTTFGRRRILASKNLNELRVLSTVTWIIPYYHPNRIIIPNYRTLRIIVPSVIRIELRINTSGIFVKILQDFLKIFLD